MHGKSCWRKKGFSWLMDTWYSHHWGETVAHRYVVRPSLRGDNGRSGRQLVTWRLQWGSREMTAAWSPLTQSQTLTIWDSAYCLHLSCLFPRLPDLEAMLQTCPEAYLLGDPKLCQLDSINHHDEVCAGVWALRRYGGQLYLVWMVILVHLNEFGVRNPWYLTQITNLGNAFSPGGNWASSCSSRSLELSVNRTLGRPS